MTLGQNLSGRETVSKFVKVDLDKEECEVIAMMCDTIEQVARMRGMNSAQEQGTRVVMSRVRAKMNVSASLFGGPKTMTDFEIQQQLPPWLRRQ